MTTYKKYLFETSENGPFPRPDLSNATEFLDQEFFTQEENRLATPPAEPVKKANKKDFKKFVVGFNSASIMNNGQFLKIDFASKEGPIEGKVWANAHTDLEEYKRDLVPGYVYEISGKWNEYPVGSGKFSAVVDSIMPSKVPSSELVPYVQENRAVLEQEMRYYISTLSEEPRELATKIYNEMRSAFIESPAAKGHHHFQNGGLLQHTVEVMRVSHNLLLSLENKTPEEGITAVEDTLFYIRRLQEKAVWTEMKKHRDSDSSGRFFSSFYEKEDHMLMLAHNFINSLKIELPSRDVVLFTDMVHDIAKVIEYSYANQEEDKYEMFFPGMVFENQINTVGVSMDPNGSRIGHITLGMMYLNQFFIREGSPEGDFLLNVLGCISAHHGKKEWGSPTCPVTSNEYLVHVSDYLDAKFSGEK